MMNHRFSLGSLIIFLFLALAVISVSAGDVPVPEHHHQDGVEPQFLSGMVNWWGNLFSQMKITLYTIAELLDPRKIPENIRRLNSAVELLKVVLDRLPFFLDDVMMGYQRINGATPIVIISLILAVVTSVAVVVLTVLVWRKLNGGLVYLMPENDMDGSFRSGASSMRTGASSRPSRSSRRGVSSGRSNNMGRGRSTSRNSRR